MSSAAAPSTGSGLPELILAKVRDRPDYPQPGIVFKDITPLLADSSALAAVVAALAAGHGEGGWGTIDKVVGIEARGFILAAPVACRLGRHRAPGHIRVQTRAPAAAEEIKRGQTPAHGQEETPVGRAPCPAPPRPRLAPACPT